MIFKRSLLFFFLISFFFTSASSQVRTGLDNLVSEKFVQLKGKKIGLICNQTSRTLNGEFAPKLFVKQKSFKLVSLFSPEHGLLGERKAGVPSDSAETFEGVPVYSLYGSNRKPARSMLRGIDALVFDIQDIGVRPYTYLSTMIYAMEAAAENNVQFIVLDRPNPLSGERIEGNILDTSLRSFVGAIPVPYLHGMTLGELAKMAKGEKWFHGAEKLKLTIIRMTGWERSMYWNETGLKWTSPSPNIPTFENAVGCAMFGAIGELGILSVGIGSDKPFLRLGSKLVKPEMLEHVLASSLPHEISAKREDYTVPYGDSTKTFLGMEIELPKDMHKFKLEELYASQFVIMNQLLADTVFARSFKALPASTKKMFEKVTGSKHVFTILQMPKKNDEGFVHWQDEASLFHIAWKDGPVTFRTMRKKYLLYQ